MNQSWEQRLKEQEEASKQMLLEERNKQVLGLFKPICIITVFLVVLPLKFGETIHFSLSCYSWSP